MLSTENVPLSSIGNLAEAVAAGAFSNGESSFQPWHLKLENASGTTDSEIEITQSHVLRQETELLRVWAAEARKFSQQESSYKLVKAADKILALKRRTKCIWLQQNLKILPVVAVSSIHNRKRRNIL